MRRPGYAETGDFAAHQSRQWARALGYALVVCVALGFGAGGLSFWSSLRPHQRGAALASYAVSSILLEVAPETALPADLVLAGVALVHASAAAGHYFEVFDQRTLGFLVSQWVFGSVPWMVLSGLLLWVALRAYRQHVFGTHQRRGAILRDHGEVVRAKRRTRHLVRGLAAAGVAAIVCLLFLDDRAAALPSYVKTSAFMGSSTVQGVLEPGWAEGQGVLWLDDSPAGFRAAELAHARLGRVFNGRPVLVLAAAYAFTTAWVWLFLGLLARTFGPRFRREPKGYRLAGVELEPGKECYHVLLCGSPGSGKSTACKDLLDQIRARGERAIIYDLSGEYLRLYFREGRDRLLSPADARSEAWTPWAEGDDPATYLALARSLFPGGGRDPFWQEAAATLFAASLEKLSKDGSNQRLYRALTQGSLDELHELLRDTDAARFLDPNGSAMPASVTATVASGLKGWRQLPDAKPGDAFSIRRFVAGEGEADDAWLFLSTTEADRAVMKPLLSLWADVASTALLSLPETHDSRIWAVFDEVASLQRLPALPGLLERGRKHGAAVLLGLQAIPQLREAYGRDQAAAIAAQPQTWLVLRSVEPDTAKWLESALGTVEVEEAHTSLSMGVDAMRDGVSFQQHVTHRPLVLASEITTLPDLTGYLKLPGAPDLWRVAYGLRDREDVAAPYVARTMKAAKS